MPNKVHVCCDHPQGDQYQDRWRYRDSKQEKKKGFLTSDFSKRDEFSNVIRTGQWREQLQLEDKFSKKAIQMFSETAGVNNSPGTQTQGHDEPETDDPNFIGASKTHRDTKNRTMQSKDRNLGQTMTTNALTYTPPSDFVKPDYARKPVIRDTFYRGKGGAFKFYCLQHHWVQYASSTLCT
eukprot:359824-Pelagomonas_calceolata.AAC.1